MSKTQTLVFQATFISIDFEEDQFGNGCIAGTGGNRMSNIISLEAESLTALQDRLSWKYGLDRDKSNWLWMASSDDRNEIDRLIYQRLEDERGIELTEAKIELWKKGKFKAWLTNYNFYVKAVHTIPYKITDTEINEVADSRA